MHTELNICIICNYPERLQLYSLVKIIKNLRDCSLSPANCVLSLSVAQLWHFVQDVNKNNPQSCEQWAGE